MYKVCGIESYQDNYLSPNETYFCEICGRHNCHLYNSDGESCEEQRRFDYKDLGYIDNWIEEPQEYIDCVDTELHKPELESDTQSTQVFVCSKCKIEWRVKK